MKIWQILFLTRMNETEDKYKEVKTKDLWSMSSAELEKHKEKFDCNSLTKKEWELKNRNLLTYKQLTKKKR